MSCIEYNNMSLEDIEKLNINNFCKDVNMDDYKEKQSIGKKIILLPFKLCIKLICFVAAIMLSIAVGILKIGTAIISTIMTLGIILSIVTQSYNSIKELVVIIIATIIISTIPDAILGLYKLCVKGMKI